MLDEFVEVWTFANGELVTSEVSLAGVNWFGCGQLCGPILVLRVRVKFDRLGEFSRASPFDASLESLRQQAVSLLSTKLWSRNTRRVVGSHGLHRALGNGLWSEFGELRWAIVRGLCPSWVALCPFNDRWVPHFRWWTNYWNIPKQMLCKFTDN